MIGMKGCENKEQHEAGLLWVVKDKPFWEEIAELSQFAFQYVPRVGNLFFQRPFGYW